MSDTKLKPCPFCGGEAVLYMGYVSYSVICTNCDFETCYRRFKRDAINAWNTRKPMDNIVAQLEERKGNVFIDGKKMYQEDYFIDIDDAIDIVKAGGVE